jgi:hypothetical protein
MTVKKEGKNLGRPFLTCGKNRKVWPLPPTLSFFLIILKPRVGRHTTSVSLKYQPASEESKALTLFFLFFTLKPRVE